jgi:arsenate reductase
LLEESGQVVEVLRYLEVAPSRNELEALLVKLGLPPSALVRRTESLYQELGLAKQTEEAILEAMLTHPVLIERPIVVVGERALIARPPERALQLL